MSTFEFATLVTLPALLHELRAYLVGRGTDSHLSNPGPPANNRSQRFPARFVRSWPRLSRFFVPWRCLRG